MDDIVAFVFDETTFQTTLDGFMFDEARVILDSVSDSNRTALATRLDDAIRLATESAHALKARIIDLGQQEGYRLLIEIASDPTTSRLLDLLAAPARQRSDIYLRDASHWAEKQHTVNSRRLNDAREALDGLDVELARAVLGKIDSHFLGSAESVERDRLLLELESRSMELEELTGTADQVIAEEKPHRRKRWKRGG